MGNGLKFKGEGERWPYSTREGAEADQKAAGERKWSVTVKADDITEALEKIKLYQHGVLSNPRVWQAPIKRIEQVGS